MKKKKTKNVPIIKGKKWLVIRNQKENQFASKKTKMKAERISLNNFQKENSLNLSTIEACANSTRT